MNPNPPKKAPVIVVTGPTAAGKSAIALTLAERFDGEVVNADSSRASRKGHGFRITSSTS